MYQGMPHSTRLPGLPCAVLKNYKSRLTPSRPCTSSPLSPPYASICRYTSDLCTLPSTFVQARATERRMSTMPSCIAKPEDCAGDVRSQHHLTPRQANWWRCARQTALGYDTIVFLSFTVNRRLTRVLEIYLSQQCTILHSVSLSLFTRPNSFYPCNRHPDLLGLTTVL